MKNIKYFLVSILFLLFIAGCEDHSNEPSGTGSVKIYLVDAPVDFDAVNIVVARVEIHMAESSDSTSGWVVVNNEIRTFNLLELRNGASAVLGDYQLSAGHYTQVRLILGEGSNVVINGVAFDLDIPSGFKTGIKLNHQFEIKANTTYEFTLDFDAFRSIHLKGTGKYSMSPVIRIIANITSGSVSGRVLPLEANPEIITTAGSDTISTKTDATGYFKLAPMPAASYKIYFHSNNEIYKDSTITNVKVDPGSNTDLGTILLSPK